MKTRSSRLTIGLTLASIMIIVSLIIQVQLLLIPALGVFLATYVLSNREVGKVSGHYRRLASEAGWAMAVANAYASSGLPPIQILHRLSDKEHSLPSIAFEIKRIFRDARIQLKSLAGFLAHEASSTKGGNVWRTLLSSIGFLERTGGDVATVMRESAQQVVASLKSELRSWANTTNTLSHAFVTALCVMPIGVLSVMVLLIGADTINLMILFTLVSLTVSILMLSSLDSKCLKLTSKYYLKVAYGKAFVWFPVSIGIGVAITTLSILGWLTIKFNIALAILIASVAFSIPAYLSFKSIAEGEDQLVTSLPELVRDVADEIRRGGSPLRALEYLSSTKSYGKHFDEVLAHLLKRARIIGYEEALKELKDRMPNVTLTTFELVGDLETLGASPGAFEAFAEALQGMVETINDYKTQLKGVKTTARVVVLMSIGIMIAILGLILPMIMGPLATAAQLPFLAQPIDVPYTTATCLACLALIMIASGLTIGKASTLKLGEAFKEVAFNSSFMLTAIIFSSYMGWI